MSRIRPWMVIVAALVAAVVAATVAYVAGDHKARGYQSHAVVVASDVVLDADSFSTPDKADRSVANQVLLAESPGILAAASKDAPDPQARKDGLSATTVKGTNAISFNATASSAQEAADAANAYAKAYVTSRLAAQTAALTKSNASLTDGLKKQLALLPGANESAAREALGQQYADEIGTNASQLAMLASRSVDDLVVQPAEAPSAPSGVSASMWALVAAVLAAAAVLALGYVALLLARRRQEAAAASEQEPARRGGSPAQPERPVANTSHRSS